MKNKKIIWLVLMLLIFSQIQVNAWVVPWTIKIWRYTENISCDTSNETKNTIWICYDSSRCKIEGSYNCPSNDWVPATSDTMNCWSTWTWACGDAVNEIPDSMNAYCWCDTYYNYAFTRTPKKITYYYDNTDEKWIFNEDSSFSVKIWEDLSNECKISAKSSGFNQHFTPVPISCTDSSSSYFSISWTAWSCISTKSRNYKNTSYDQLWNKSFILEPETEKYWGPNFCYVQWRYADRDDEWPEIVISWVDYLFSWEQWCNIDKYLGRWKYGSDFEYDENKNENLWCEDYKERSISDAERLAWKTFDWERPDLLRNLKIEIKDDISWVGSVKIKIWSCEYNIEHNPTVELPELIKDNNNDEWVKDKYKKWFIITKSTIIGSGAIKDLWTNLLSGFNITKNPDITRLDECLVNWKNKIIVTTKDMARNAQDWTSLQWNYKTKEVEWLLIDIWTPKLSVTDTLNSFYEKKDNTNWNLVVWKWNNESLKWNIIFSDSDWFVDRENECSSFTGSLTWQCTNILSTNEIYVLPAGVDPYTWEFKKFKCWGLWPFPNNSDCKKWCAKWTIFDPITSKCIVLNWICNDAIQWWEQLEDFNFMEHKRDGICLPYCMPWHSLNCIVKV